MDRVARVIGIRIDDASLLDSCRRGSARSRNRVPTRRCPTRPSRPNATARQSTSGSAGSAEASARRGRRMTVDVSRIAPVLATRAAQGLASRNSSTSACRAAGSRGGSRRHRASNASATSGGCDAGRSSATALPARVIVIDSPRAARPRHRRRGCAAHGCSLRPWLIPTAATVGLKLGPQAARLRRGSPPRSPQGSGAHARV